MLDWDGTGIADRVLAERVTHVVVPEGRTIRSRRFVLSYADSAYRVYRLQPDN